jgi:hypothetical protein
MAADQGQHEQPSDFRSAAPVGAAGGGFDLLAQVGGAAGGGTATGGFDLLSRIGAPAAAADGIPPKIEVETSASVAGASGGFDLLATLGPVSPPGADASIDQLDEDDAVEKNEALRTYTSPPIDSRTIEETPDLGSRQLGSSPEVSPYEDSRVLDDDAVAMGDSPSVEATIEPSVSLSHGDIYMSSDDEADLAL